MTGLNMHIPVDIFDALDTALTRPEEVVFLYGSYTDTVIEIDVIEIMAGDDIASQSKLHVELADDVRPRVIKTAWDTSRCLIEAHSHGDWGRAEFSSSDLRGFADWVRHVRWRLRDRPYVALVKAGETWDALAWVDGDEPIAIAAIHVMKEDVTTQTVIPTNATVATLASKDQED